MKEHSEIKYDHDYGKEVNYYCCDIGRQTLLYINYELIRLQRDNLGWFLKELGTNISQLSSLSSMKLPLNMYNERAVMEIFAFQHVLAPIFLNKAAQEEFALEKIKITTVWALSSIHMILCQLKPFTHKIGDTFQAKIGDMFLYCEQTTLKDYNFYMKGEEFKIYGHLELRMTIYINSSSIDSIGKYIIEYADGIKHQIIIPGLILEGTGFGDRTTRLARNLYIIDEVEDFISIVEFNPDDRNFFTKLFTFQQRRPDFVKLSHCVFNKEYNSYEPKSDHFPFVTIKGEFTKEIYIDDELYWKIEDYKNLPLERMEFTLPSDCNLEDELMLFKAGFVDLAQSLKDKSGI